MRRFLTMGLMLSILPVIGAVADDEAKVTADKSEVQQLRMEMAEIKQLLTQLSERLKTLEDRVNAASSPRVIVVPHTPSPSQHGDVEKGMRIDALERSARFKERIELEPQKVPEARDIHTPLPMPIVPELKR